MSRPYRHPAVLVAVLAVVIVLIAVLVTRPSANRPATVGAVLAPVVSSSPPAIASGPAATPTDAGSAPSGSPPAGPSDAPASPRPPKTPGPVVLVPGYGNGVDDLDGLAARLRAAGRDVTIVSLPGDGTGDLVEQAKKLAEVVNRVLDGGDSVDVVGYSAGGVVTRIWLVDLGGAALARHVVTLGAPLHGTATAALGAHFAPGLCYAACHQLTPNSALLARLNGVPLPADVTWMSVWTTADQVVVPPTSAALTGAVNVSEQDICPGVATTHEELPSDPLVIGLVLRGLGDDPVTAPTPDDCAALRSAGDG